MKRGLGFLFLFSLIVISSVSFISASFFDNFLGKITGNPVDESVICGSVELDVYFMAKPESTTILHRTTRKCADDSPVVDQYGRIEQVFPVGSGAGYNNYRCQSRKQEQCYDDGSFDTYYGESCDYPQTNEYILLSKKSVSLDFGETKEVYGNLIHLNGFADMDSANIVTNLKSGAGKNYNPLMFSRSGVRTVNFGSNFDLDLDEEVNVNELYNYLKLTSISIDDDCIQDNTTEEGECVSGNIQICGTNIGGCYFGYRTCQQSRVWGECAGNQEPVQEICDGIDNDCDSFIDEEIVCNSNTTLCLDSDSGPGSNQYYIKGKTTSESGGTGIVSLDYCGQDGKVLIENYCSLDSTIGKEEYVCPGACVDGACVDVEDNGGCFDSDGGVDYYVKGYVYSSIGLQAPESGWDDCLDDNYQSNLVIDYNGVVIKPSTGTKISETFCNVNKMYGVVIEDCLYGCYDGACIIEGSNETSPSLDPGEGTIPGYVCSGCELEDQCFTFGYRKDGQYCSDKEKFVEQHGDDASCENNFECTSNLCISGKCLSQSLVERILRWFGRFFRD